MSNGSELKSPAAKALRAAGFVPLPRWWVKVGEDFDLIQYIAQKHSEEVSRIRSRVGGTVGRERKKREIEAAWKSREREG